MANRRLLLAFSGALLVASGCLGAPSTPAAIVFAQVQASVDLPDVTLPGVLKVLRLEYDFGFLVLQDSRMAPYPSVVRGSVHFPETGEGPYPLVLFMHGRHSTCRVVTSETLGPVACPDSPATGPVNSFVGYDYLVQPLASHGYVVVSINANNLNDLDATMGDSGAVGRARLIARTLDEFAALNAQPGPAPIGGKLVGRIDVSRIGLMGHSRGGEGVTRFISYNEGRTDGPRYELSAVFALAPTDFARWKVANVTHAALLPYCDGDVSNLQGAWMYDDARYVVEAKPSPKIQILAMGANHNNYNTIWTGDDGGRFNLDPHCGPTNPVATKESGRLSPADQRRHGRLYMEAFFRHYVGGEAALGGLFTGAARTPPEACPEGQSDCPDRIHVSYRAPFPQRLVVEDTLDRNTLSGNDLGGRSVWGTFVNLTTCAPAQCPSRPNYAQAYQLTLGWKKPDGWRTEIPARFANVSRFDALSMRVGVNFQDAKNEGRATQDFRVVLTDAEGRSASVLASDHSNALFNPPGTNARKVTLNMVRLPLDAFAGIDLSSVRAVELVFDATPTGSVQFTDLMFQDEP